MKRRLWRWLVRLIVAGAFSFASAWTLFPFPAGKLQRFPSGVTVLDRNGNVVRVTLGENDVDCQPVSLEQTGPWLGKAAVAVEDHRFWRHGGFDVLALAGRLQDLEARGLACGVVGNHQAVSVPDSRHDPELVPHVG